MIFFVALVQLLYYWGTLQWVIEKFAVFFFWSMRVSGAEAVVAAASPFIGQGESAMLIKPFVAHLTQAELHQVMCSGFATIAYVPLPSSPASVRMHIYFRASALSANINQQVVVPLSTHCILSQADTRAIVVLSSWLISPWESTARPSSPPVL